MSGIGPILIFDKSTLQGLSIDESVWLDAFFYPNITPLFFVETLADIEKEAGRGRTPEQIVGNLAEKTPTGGHPNVSHHTMCVAELLGHKIEMKRVPIIPSGEQVNTGIRRGIVVREPPERAALQRWQEGKFLDVEREFARTWRQALSTFDLDATYRQGRDIVDRHGRPRDLTEAKTTAMTLLNKPGSRYFREALQALEPADLRRRILRRWADNGSPPIEAFAPYTAHVFTIDLFFAIALGSDLISRERPSNKMDIAYLYYLPFCMIFTSHDNLHSRTAPLFLNSNQEFIGGSDLKADLAKLDRHYSVLSDEVKERGVISFAHYPPTEGDFLVSRMWDKFMGRGWREDATNTREPVPEDERRRLVEQFREISEASEAIAGQRFSQKEADAVVIQRSVPIRRGKWRLVPPEAENSG
jgi:hypothetical protein